MDRLAKNGVGCKSADVLYWPMHVTCFDDDLGFLISIKHFSSALHSSRADNTKSESSRNAWTGNRKSLNSQ